MNLWEEERATHKSFRPVTTFLWRILADVVGHVSPLYSRFLSCVGHTVACLVLLRIARHSLFSRVPTVWRFVVCMLFAAHPVHVENIVYCVGFADSLSTIFLGLAFLGAVSSTNRLAVCCLCTLSALSKESGFVSYLLVFSVDFLRFPKFPRRYLPQLLVAVAAPLLRFWYVGGSPVNFAYVDVPYIYERSAFVRGLSYLHAHSVYARLSVFPWNMSWDYSFDAVPLVRSVLDLRMLGSVATYSGVSAIFWSAFKNFDLLHVLTVGMFILPFVPASSLFIAVGTVVGERLLYPVTFGLALLLIVSEFSKIIKVGFYIILPVYCVLAYQRVSVWSSKFSLYSTDAVAWPRSCKTLHQYGAMLLNSDKESALAVLERSLEIFDDNALTDYLISQIFIEKKDFIAAIGVHNKIANGHGIGFTDFSRFMFLVDAGYVLIASGDISQYPVNLIEEGLEIYGWVLHARNALGVAYLHLSRLEEAIDHLEFASHICVVDRRLSSTNCEIVYSNLAVAYAVHGDRATAGNALQEALALAEAGNRSAQEVTQHNYKWFLGETEYPRTEIFYERFT